MKIADAKPGMVLFDAGRGIDEMRATWLRLPGGKCVCIWEPSEDGAAYFGVGVPFDCDKADIFGPFTRLVPEAPTATPTNTPDLP